MTSWIAPENSLLVKAVLGNGELIYRALWDSRSKAKQQDKTEKQVAVKHKKRDWEQTQI